MRWRTALSEISLTGDQMITVLETVAQSGPISAAEVARLCDINRTVAHRLLVTLASRAYIRKSGTGYVVGPALRALARIAEPELIFIAKPVMKRLVQETGETVVLNGIDGPDAMVLDQVVGKKHVVRVEHAPGSRHPLFKGASGWALLAYQNNRMIDRLLAKVDDRQAALDRIARVKADGYAFSHDELQIGVSGVAAPILGADSTCSACLAIIAPNSRAASLETLVPSLLKAVDALTRQIG
jgi:DNA-binding IclR family transcriptional regulator